MGHPPNRFEFITNDGLSRIIKVLQAHGKNEDIQIQGMGVILNMFIDDPHSLYKIPQARQNALGAGLGVVLDDNLLNFKKNKRVIALTTKLQNSLLSEYM